MTRTGLWWSAWEPAPGLTLGWAVLPQTRPAAGLLPTPSSAVTQPAVPQPPGASVSSSVVGLSELEPSAA